MGTKRLKILCFIMAMAFIAMSFSGCGKNKKKGKDVEPIKTVVDVYCVQLEDGCLYLQDSDASNTHPELLMDMKCTAYAHHDNKIAAAFEDGSIQQYDIATKQWSRLASVANSTVEKIVYYCDDGIVYTDCDTDGKSEVYRWRSGQTKKLLGKEANAHNIYVSDNALVCKSYDIDTDTNNLLALNIADGKVRWSEKPSGCKSFNLVYQKGNAIYAICDDTRLCKVGMERGSLETLEVPFNVSSGYKILGIGPAGYLLQDYGAVTGAPGVYLASGKKDITQLTDIPSGSAGRNYEYSVVDSVNGNVLVCCTEYADETIIPGDEPTTYEKRSYHVIDMSTGTVCAEFHLHSNVAQMFEDGNFPILDCAMGKKEVCRDIYSMFCLGSGFNGRKPALNSGYAAWTALADGKTDIALLQSPTAEDLAYLSSKDIKINMKLYGGDGLVLAGNSSTSKVPSLTIEEIKSIYRGEITNWSQLGGKDASIHVFYQAKQTPAEKLFEQLVWGDEKVPDYETLGFSLVGDDEDICTICENTKYAICYDTMSCLNTISDSDYAMIFSVNGIDITTANIMSGKYPLAERDFVAINAKQAAGSPAMRLYDWFGTSLCDDILRKYDILPLHGYDKTIPDTPLTIDPESEEPLEKIN